MLVTVGLGLLLTAGVSLSGLGTYPAPGFLIWHMLVEGASICIAGMIFAFGWSTRAQHRQAGLLLAACAFLGVAILDFSHMLSFVGMPQYITPNSEEKAILFWLASRYLAAVALLVLVWQSWRTSQSPPSPPLRHRYLLLSGVLLLCISVHVLIFGYQEHLPRTFIPGQGLTLLKITLEYGVVALHVLTILLLLPLLGCTTRFNVPLLIGTLLLSIMSELMFTLYASATDIYNLAGHLQKILAYLLLYRAMFSETVSAPYQALNEAHRRNAALLRAIPDLMFELDQQGRHVRVHSQHPAELQALQEWVLGRTLEECLPAASAATLREAMQQSDEGGSSRHVQISVEVPQRGLRDYEVQISKVPLDDQSGTRFMMLARDITDRLREQAQLRQLRLAVEQSPSPIMITDLSSRIEYVNQAFSRFSGYRPQEVIGHDPSMLKSGQTPPEVYQQMWQQLLAGNLWRGEFINRRKDGTYYHEAALVTPITDENGRPTHYLAIKEDITQRKRDQERIEHLAHYDALTGLPNRTLFRSHFDKALSMARRHGHGLGLMFIDLDHFKNINDSLGHRYGDLLLMAVTARLFDLLREEDSLSRQGGDEFMLLLPCCDANSAAHMAERLIHALEQPFTVEGHQLRVSASVGIALFPEDGEGFDELAQHADAAMYRAKHAGRHGYCFFTREMQQQSAHLLRLENDLRQALERKELQLYYQPQQRIGSHMPCGLEALLRWQHPTLGMISPAEFIPVAESSGLIIQIGRWVLEEACRQLASWQAADLLSDATMAVNLSLRQLQDPWLAEQVADVLHATGLPACCLELELTESVAMHNPQAAIDTVRALHRLGVQLAIDDFGTGYSSLAYLKQFQVHMLKIDQSFVRNLCEDANDQSIVSAVIDMAARLGIGVIAEGVETLEQLSKLAELDCEQIQGYLLSRPLPAEQLELWLHERSQQPIAPAHFGEHI